MDVVVPAASAVHRCKHCLREFGRAEHLIRHERTHTKEKPYRCDQCPQCFARRDLLKRHEIRAHGLSRAPRHRHRSHASSESSPKTTREDVSGPPDSGLPSEPCALQALATQMDTTVDTWSFTKWLESGPVWEPGVEAPNWPGDQLEHHSSGTDNCIAGASSSSLQFSLFNELFEAPDLLKVPNPTPPFTAAPQSLVDTTSTILSTTSTRRLENLAITPEYWGKIQAQVTAAMGPCTVPSAVKMSQYISRYLACFHRHQPLFHEHTWHPSESPVVVTLAVCANGALYLLENQVGHELYRMAAAIAQGMSRREPDISNLQLGMLMVAFGAWSGRPEDLEVSMQFHGRLAIDVRRAWAGVQPLGASPTWKMWLEREVLKRATYCCFTVMNLMTIAYDVASQVRLEDKFGLPGHEERWCAADEASWAEASRQTITQEWPTAESVIQRLADESLPVPSRIGMFGCHVVISFLCHKIMLFRKACTGDSQAYHQGRQHFALCLRRWQMMWETEPGTGSVLQPDHPLGPILFNSTAVLRVAHIRLAADHTPIRSAFASQMSEENIAEEIRVMPPLSRDAHTCRAALQACLALRIPAQLGFSVVARAGFWAWSVQHALSYFECALMLVHWLHGMEDVTNLTPDEVGILSLVDQILDASRSGQPSDSMRNSSASAILTLFRRLLDTGELTVWALTPKMARVLEAWSKRP